MRFRILLLVVMAVLVPVRALATVTTGFCALAHGHGPAALDAMPSDHAHDPDNAQHSPDSKNCGSCGEHCSSAAFVASFVAATPVAAASGERCSLHVRSFAGFVPDQLDPPPLAA